MDCCGTPPPAEVLVNVEGGAASLPRSAASEFRIFWLFVILGWGTQWLPNDALNQCMGVFITVLPEGLNLPQVASSLWGNICASAGVALWMLVFSCGREPTLRVYTTCGWVLVVIGALCMFLAAVGWKWTVDHSSVIVIGTVGITNMLGQMTYMVQMPMLALFFQETTVSAVMTGAGMGSLFAGLLGLIQTADPDGFGPSPLLALVTVLCLASVVAWMHILHNGVGRLPPSYSTKPAKASEASELLPAPAPRALFDGYTLSVWLMGAIINYQTWGLTFLQYATTKSSCTCDTHERGAQLVYQLATSLSYLAMPVGGLLSYFAPSLDLRTHWTLTAIHIVAYVFQTLAVAGVRFMTCSAGAQTVVVLSNILIRGIYQYLTALQFIMLGRHFERSPGLRERSVMVYGLIVSWAAVLTSFASYALTESNVVQCVAADFPATHESAAGLPQLISHHVNQSVAHAAHYESHLGRWVEWVSMRDLQHGAV